MGWIGAIYALPEEDFSAELARWVNSHREEVARILIGRGFNTGDYKVVSFRVSNRNVDEDYGRYLLGLGISIDAIVNGEVKNIDLDRAVDDLYRTILRNNRVYTTEVPYEEVRSVKHRDAYDLPLGTPGRYSLPVRTGRTKYVKEEIGRYTYVEDRRMRYSYTYSISHHKGTTKVHVDVWMLFRFILTD